MDEVSLPLGDSADNSDILQRIRWMDKIRKIVALLLFGSTILACIYMFAMGRERVLFVTREHLLALLTIEFMELCVNTPFGFILSRLGNPYRFGLAQATLDMCLITALTYVLGGIDFPLSVGIYSFGIAFIGVVLGGRCGYWLAALSSVLYSFVVVAQAFHWIPVIRTGPWGDLPAADQLVIAALNVAVFWLMAYFGADVMKMFTNKERARRQLLDSLHEVQMAKEKLELATDQLVQSEEEIVRRGAENRIIQAVSIRALTHLTEIRDRETGNHILRTQDYIRVLAIRLRSHPRFSATLNERYIDLLVHSAPLHDIGKVGIPDHILQKPGPLNADEWEIMKSHVVLGANALELAERDMQQTAGFLDIAKEIVRSHHERWDGAGYPDGLSGEAIPLSARMMALVDVFDAVISHRVYKAAIRVEQARDIIAAGRGTQFDPDVTDAFLAGFEAFAAIARSHRDEY